MAKTILYAEECENTLANALIARPDIRLILIRFSHCMHFSQEHLKKTVAIPTFVIDKKVDIRAEANRLKAFLQAQESDVDFFFNDSEFNQEYIQQVAWMLSLPGALSVTQSRIVRNKVIMKDFIRNIGYECPDYQQLYCLEDVLLCAQTWGYPFIVKWRSGVSSIGVYRVGNEAQILELNLDYTSGKYMAERFCPYMIWCIDAIVSGGQVRDNLYTWLPYTNLDFAVGKKRFIQMAVGQKPDWWQFDPYKLTQRIVKELGVSSGYLHLEAFITGEGIPIICEFAWRTPGEHMLSNFSLLYSTDIPNRLIDVMLGLPVENLKATDCCVADVFLPMKEGLIMEISSIEELKERCCILNGAVFYKTGDLLINKHKYTDSTGWVQLHSKGINDMMKKIDGVYRKFCLRVEDYSYEKSGTSNQ